METTVGGVAVVGLWWAEPAWSENPNPVEPALPAHHLPPACLFLSLSEALTMVPSVLEYLLNPYT